MKALAGLAMVTAGLWGQDAPAVEALRRQADRLEGAIRNKEWGAAQKEAGALRRAAEELRDQEAAGRSRRQVAQFLAALPGNVESVLVAPQPVEFRERDPRIGQPMQVAARLVAARMALELDAFPPAITVRFGATAAREFRIPAADANGRVKLGGFEMKACSVAGKYETVADVENAAERMAGFAVGVVEKKAGSRDAQYFWTKVEPDTVLACNNRDMMREILTAWNTGAGSALLPPGHAIWPHVDREAAAWGIRLRPAAPDVGTDFRNFDPSLVNGMVGSDFDAFAFSLGRGQAGPKAVFLAPGAANPWNGPGGMFAMMVPRKTVRKGDAWVYVSSDGITQEQEIMVFLSILGHGFFI